MYPKKLLLFIWSHWIINFLIFFFCLSSLCWLLILNNDNNVGLNYEWMTWYSILKKYFCLPCLLFYQHNNTWTTTGYYDLKNLTKALTNHEKISEPWKPLSDNELIQQSITGKQRRLSCINHNKLKSFLSCIKMLACQELPFGGYYEIEDNRGHFLARCGTVTEYSDCLRSRFRFCEEKCQMYMSSRLLYFREFYSFLSFSTFEVRCRKK